MKKSVLLSVLLVLALAAPLFAADAVGPDAEREAHYQEMKAIKAAQREAHKKDAGATAQSSNGFWHKEAERSGLSRLGNAGNWFQNLNPMPFFKSQDEQYKARKAAQEKAK